MIKFAAFRPKRYSSLTDDSEENKKAKITNKWVEKKKPLNLEIINIVSN